MSNTGIKIAAYALTGAIAFTSFQLPVDAAGLSSSLPVAGIALALNEGNSVESMKKGVGNSANGTSEKSADIILEVGEAAEAPIKNTKEEKKSEIAEAVEVEKETVQEEAEQEMKQDFSSLVIAEVNDYVNIRSKATEEGEVVGKLYDKSVGSYLQEKNGWYEITSGSVTGFVKSEYVVTGENAVQLAGEVGVKLATVTTTTLKVRETPSKDAPVLGLVPEQDDLTVLEESDDWVKVSIEEGEGYVSKEFVRLHTEFIKAESKAEEEARLEKEEAERRAAQAAADAATAKGSKKSSSGSSKNTPPPAVGGSGRGASVANYATQFVGNPYVYGGTSLTNGADCSGFVMSVYANFGVSLPHSSGALRSKGSDVGGLGNAQPGDLVCYSGHVGIYIGGGNIVHASTVKTGIKISNASYRQVLSVRRIF